MMSKSGPTRDIRVLLLGDFKPPYDEGMKKTAHNISRSSQMGFTILPFQISYPEYISQIIPAVRFRPHVIHLLHGPTAIGIVFTSLFARVLLAKSIVSATHPVVPRELGNLLRPLRVDRIIVMSRRSGDELRHLARTVDVISSGVDLDVFRPVDARRRSSLRAKYGYSDSDFIVFHAGPVVRSRNLEWLHELPGRSFVTIVAASNTTAIDGDVARRLKEKRIQVLDKYFENIEELYQISDCYVFCAVSAGASMEFPLSVLEAMACGVPVVSTRYGALNEVEGLPGLTTVNSVEEFVSGVENLRTRPGSVDPYAIRESVKGYSWTAVHDNLNRIYREAVKS